MNSQVGAKWLSKQKNPKKIPLKIVKGKEQTENEWKKKANGQRQTERPSEILQSYYFRQNYLKKKQKTKTI